ncbi:MAG: SH3 domain-containing protein, partial [Rhodospirillaceae bacterium]|nr:SH3 domain-containing protein [Rhodospirillaceae bacterium]
DGDGTVSLGEVKRYLDDAMSYAAKRRYGRTQTATVLGDEGAQLASVVAPKSMPVQAPTPAAPAFTVTALDQTMVVVDVASLNVRDAPSGAKVGNLSGGAEVEVTGRTDYEGADWFRVALSGGGVGYVFGKYLREKPAASVMPIVSVYPKPSPPPKLRLAKQTPEPDARKSTPSPTHRTRPSNQILIVNATGLNISSSASRSIKDVVRRSFAGLDWNQVDNITVRLTDVGARTENNPDYAGAKIAQGLFGAILGGGRGLPLGNIPRTVNYYHAEATVIAFLKDGNSWTDDAALEAKGSGNRNKSSAVADLVMKVVQQAVNRVVIRMSGGVPPVPSNDLTQGNRTGRTSEPSSNWVNPDDDPGQ